MLVNIGNFIRMLVRPAVTVGLVVGVVINASLGNMDAAKEIGIYAAVAITFWFGDRSKANQPAENGDQ